ncbi:MAG: hypothetical protein ACXABY_25050 [Candidatus Thorarchaeota archaeon]|jgi:hypothetical protein
MVGKRPWGVDSALAHNVELVEFATLRHLFHFLVTHSMPTQQYASVIRYRDYTYVMAPAGEIVELFFTRDAPQAEIYSWTMEKDEFNPVSRLDKSSYNIIIQNVVYDSIIEKTFYKRRRK